MAPRSRGALTQFPRKSRVKCSENGIADRSTDLEKIPLGQLGDVSDIASAVVYLIEDAPYVNGQIIAVDGGRSLNM